MSRPAHRYANKDSATLFLNSEARERIFNVVGVVFRRRFHALIFDVAFKARFKVKRKVQKGSAILVAKAWDHSRSYGEHCTCFQRLLGWEGPTMKIRPQERVSKMAAAAQAHTGEIRRELFENGDSICVCS